MDSILHSLITWLGSTEPVIIKADIRGLVGPVRDQGRRPTCLAFAVTAAHETQYKLQHLLCPEWLYYHAVTRAGDPPDAGSTFEETAAALAIDGQPEEFHWPYCGDVLPSPWTPPMNPLDLYHTDGKLNGLNCNRVREALKNCTSTIIALLIDHTLFKWSFDRGHAIIVDSPPPYDSESGHAVLVVGHGELNGKPHFLIRNSWGLGWGDNGHAWISEDYAKARIYGTMELLEI